MSAKVMEALPELPEARVLGVSRGEPAGLVRGYTADQMRAYAGQAIEAADQARGGEAVAEVIDYRDGGSAVLRWNGKPVPVGTKFYTHPADGVDQWQPIETAPKSVADGRHVEGIYLLGFVPDPDAVDLSSCMDTIWWEPLLTNSNGGRGRWCAGKSDLEVHPTHWQPLPNPPQHSKGRSDG